MTAFLFIPSAASASRGQRVNFADIANLFVESDQPVVRRGGAPFMRIALAALILLGAIGDTLLVTRSDVVANCLASGHAGRPAVAAAGS